MRCYRLLFLSTFRAPCFRRNLHLAPPFLVYDYITNANLQSPEVLREKLHKATEELQSCRACPRNCDVNRLLNQKGLCNVGRNVIIRLTEIELIKSACVTFKLFFFQYGVSTFWRGNSFAGLEGIGNHILWNVQPQVCFLSELGYKSTETWKGVHCQTDGGAHDSLARSSQMS